MPKLETVETKIRTVEGFKVEVLNGQGEAISGQTKLAKVRATY